MSQKFSNFLVLALTLLEHGTVITGGLIRRRGRLATQTKFLNQVGSDNNLHQVEASRMFLSNRLGKGRQEVLHILHILENIQFACSRIIFCIWAMALLLASLPVVQQGRKAEGSEILQGQTENHIFAVPVRKCLRSHYCFFQIGECCVACYDKIFVLLYFVETLN